MLKKLKPIGNGIHKWKLWLRIPGQKPIHRHIQATEADAHKLHAELLDAKNRASVGLTYKIPTQSKPIADAAIEFEKYQRQLGENEKHISNVQHTIAMLQQVTGNIPVAQVTREHVIAWRSKRAEFRRYEHSKPTSARTVNKCLSHLSAFFEFCAEPGWIEVNPAKLVRKVKETKPAMKVLPWANFCAFTDAAWKVRPELALLLEIVGETGCRISDAVNAKVSHVIGNQRIFERIVKGGRRIQFDAEPWTLAAADGRKPDEWLCPRKNGKRWTAIILRQQFARLCRLAKIPEFTAHAIRHGRACWDIIEGKTVWQVRNKLGHTSVTTTEKYLRAAEILRRSEPAGVIHTRPVVLQRVAKALVSARLHSGLLGSARKVRKPQSSYEKSGATQSS